MKKLSLMVVFILMLIFIQQSIFAQEISQNSLDRTYSVAVETIDLEAGYKKYLPQSKIFINEIDMGAIEQGTTFMLEVESLKFAGDPKIEVISSNMEIDARIEQGKLLLQVNKASSDKPAQIEIFDYTLIYEGESIEEGGRSLYCTDSNNRTNPIKLDYITLVDTRPEEWQLPFVGEISLQIGSNIIYVNDNKYLMDASAYISDSGYTMLPLRALSDVLTLNEGEVIWENNTAYIVYGPKIIQTQLGSNILLINGNPYYMSAKSEVVDGRIFIPLRDFCNAFEIEDTEIIWNSIQKSVKINMN